MLDSTLLTTVYGQTTKAPQLPPHMGRLLRCPSPIHVQDSRTNSKRTVPWSTYSTCLDFHLLDWDALALPSHRLIARPIRAMPEPLRCDALPTRLFAPVRGRKIKPKAYCSQRCHPPAKAWWWHPITLVHLVWARIWRTFFSLSPLTIRIVSKPLPFCT